jgi:hypothetical protein
LALAVHADQDGKRPVLIGGEGQGHLQRKDHEVVTKGEERALLCGAQGVVVHASAPDVAPGFTGQGIIDGADQNLCTKRQQQLENAVAQIVEIPAGLAEKAVEGTVMLELRELCRLKDAG